MKFILVVFIIICNGFVFSQQTRPDSIYLVKDKFYQNGNLLPKYKCNRALRGNPASKQLFSKSQNVNVLAQVLGTVGGGCIGYFVADRYFGGDSSVGLLVGGGVCILFSIPISIESKQRLKQSITKYNQL